MAHNEELEANPFASPETDLTTKAERQTEGTVVYAEFGTRFVAALVDGLIVNGLVFIVAFAAGMVLSAEQLQGGAALVLQLLGYIIGWLYNSLQECSEAQATLGKRMMGIKVVDLEGRRISFGRATGRHFGKILSAMILLIGFIMQQFTKKRQALHDIMAGTLVIKG